MLKKLSKKHTKIKRNSSRNNIKKMKRGKASFGAIAVLLVVFSLGLALVFGNQRLSSMKTQLQSSFTCCDSGNGELCQPNTAVSFMWNGDEYDLLKTGVAFFERSGHLAPVLPLTEVTINGQPFSTVNPGQYVIFSDSEQAYQGKYLGTCSMFGDPNASEHDTLYYPASVTKYNTKNPCLAIPNDMMAYVCTKGCDNNGEPLMQGENTVFNAYIRRKDIETGSGTYNIPEAIKDCEPPPESKIQEGKQRIINLPSPSGKPNLQLETFYITNDQVVANWVSPWCKPAVYLYPIKKEAVQVSINPIGKLLYSDPTYPQGGWNVTAYPDGRIYYNDTKFDYLFYEAEIADKNITLPKEGFVVDYNLLSAFLPDLVSRLGLNTKETKQFSEYWLKVLPKSSYYQIKIVKEDVLEKISPLTIIPLPKTIIRVTLHFTPLDKKIDTVEPQVSKLQRNGFTVVEWGGIYKRDLSHPFSCLM
jgi:hypothetical protein